MNQDLIIKSECESFHYVEHVPVEGGDKGACMVIGLSPHRHGKSRVERAKQNCVEYAKRSGYSAVILVHLYALLDTDPEILPRLANSVGPENNHWILKAAQDSDLIIGAWGDFPRIKARVYEVMNLLEEFDIYAVQTNRNGSPSHPLSWKNKAAKLYRRARPSTSGKVAS